MATTESISSNDRTQMEAWLAELKLSPQLSENAIEILGAWKNQFEYGPHSNHRINYQDLLAASLYAAMKADPMCAGTALHDFLVITKTSKKGVLRRYREMVLDMDVTPQACSMKPGPYLDALAEKIQANEEIKAKALELLSVYMGSKPIQATRPVGPAAAVLYLSIRELYAPDIRRQMRGGSMVSIASETSLTEATIRKYVRQIEATLLAAPLPELLREIALGLETTKR